MTNHSFLGYMENPLFVLAHPDDEALFVHTIKTFSSGARILIATDGKASTIDNNGECFCP